MILRAKNINYTRTKAADGVVVNYKHIYVMKPVFYY